MMMRPKDFNRLLARDHYCLHCGAVDALSPNHRANRGMGGSKLRDTPSNLVVLCSLFNGLIESDAVAAALAQRFGWKLSSWDNPLEVPVFDSLKGEWRLLDDDYGFIVFEDERE